MKPEIVGIFAGILTTCCFVPQAYKTYVTKHTRDLSLLYLTMLNIGVALWLAYGILSKNYIIITFNAATLVCALFILYFKVYNMVVLKESK